MKLLKGMAAEDGSLGMIRMEWKKQSTQRNHEPANRDTIKNSTVILRKL